MTGGTISGNNSTRNGGGVYIADAAENAGGLMIKTGGIIYGNDEPDDSLKNTVSGGNGHAVWWPNSPYVPFYRNSTLGANDNISTIGGDWTNWGL